MILCSNCAHQIFLIIQLEIIINTGSLGHQRPGRLRQLAYTAPHYEFSCHGNMCARDNLQHFFAYYARIMPGT